MIFKDGIDGGAIAARGLRDAIWNPVRSRFFAALLILSVATAPPSRAEASPGAPTSADAHSRVALSRDGRGFVILPAGEPFVPVGFNYDHDDAGRLLEDYWNDEWATVEEDFAEMRALGANVVRVHLQLGRFLLGPDRADPGSLRRLGDLLDLAARHELRLDVTGLGLYHKADVPPWLDALDESARWEAQAVFWREVARVARGHAGLFCHDLMNEPVVAGDGGRTDWLGEPFGGKHFVQFVALDARGRPRPEIALAWTRRMAGAIRESDPDALVTIGLVPWSLDRPGLTSGFVPSVVAPELDFVSVHLYPKRGAIDEAIGTLRGFAEVGKPVLIEETFPLECGIGDFARFHEEARPLAAGWIGFYWGRPLEELRATRRISIRDAMMHDWLAFFVERIAPDGRPAPRGRGSDPRSPRDAD